MSLKGRSRSRKRGLTNVVTTLILLTFLVLLALTATWFTSGLTRARIKSAGQENVRSYKTHVRVEGLSNGTRHRFSSIVGFRKTQLKKDLEFLEYGIYSPYPFLESIHGACETEPLVSLGCLWSVHSTRV